jgi:hypothetical protein
LKGIYVFEPLDPKALLWKRLNYKGLSSNEGQGELLKNQLRMGLEQQPLADCLKKVGVGSQLAWTKHESTTYCCGDVEVKRGQLLEVSNDR